MKKILNYAPLLFLIVNLYGFGCKKTKITYTQAEINYTDSLRAFINNIPTSLIIDSITVSPSLNGSHVVSIDSCDKHTAYNFGERIINSQILGSNGPPVYEGISLEDTIYPVGYVLTGPIFIRYNGFHCPGNLQYLPYPLITNSGSAPGDINNDGYVWSASAMPNRITLQVDANNPFKPLGNGITYSVLFENSKYLTLQYSQGGYTYIKFYSNNGR